MSMRKIILFIHSTFNGVVTGDPGEDKTNFMVWTTPASVETGSEWLLKQMDQVDTILLGRKTYEDLARKWPFVADWPGVNDLALRLGEKVNQASKFIVAREHPVAQPRWGEFAAPQQLVGHDVEKQIEQLKAADGGDIMIFGSPTLVRSLTDATLIDEYQIQVHPVVVNVGEHLFDAINARKDFRLLRTEPLEDGSFVVTYQPAKP
jgi:dihydrofolate reductase